MTSDTMIDSAMDASTSLGVWQPKYILEKPTARKRKTLKLLSHIFFAFNARGK
jgi:hypothetical protein